MPTVPRTADRPLACIVMAGGKGTRMRSELPKVLHPIWGRPLLGWVLSAVREAGAERVVVVVPPDAAEAVAAVVGDAETVVQPDQLGTGDAVRCALPALRKEASDASNPHKQRAQNLLRHYEAIDPNDIRSMWTECPLVFWTRPPEAPH